MKRARWRHGWSLRPGFELELESLREAAHLVRLQTAAPADVATAVMIELYQLERLAERAEPPQRPYSAPQAVAGTVPLPGP